MLLKTSFPYTGGFLCCPNKMVRFTPFGTAVPGFCKYRNHETGIWLDCVTVSFFKGKLDRLTIYWGDIRPVLRIYNNN